MNDLKSNKKILIVDDAILCDLVTRVIQSTNRTFLIATNVGNARTILELEPVDLILLDPNIENGGGIALLDDLKRRSSAFRRQPQTIVMTAAATESQGKLHQQGEIYYLNKPFQISRLRTLVQELLIETELE
jgi:response regulator of citrate/malate metabolism